MTALDRVGAPDCVARQRKRHPAKRVRRVPRGHARSRPGRSPAPRASRRALAAMGRVTANDSNPTASATSALTPKTVDNATPPSTRSYAKGVATQTPPTQPSSGPSFRPAPVAYFSTGVDIARTNTVPAHGELLDRGHAGRRVPATWTRSPSRADPPRLREGAAAAYLDAWNSHDLDRLLARMTDDPQAADEPAAVVVEASAFERG
jgi:hypothetical protein